MTIRWSENSLTVRRGTAPRVRGGTWGTAESAFWAKLKTALNQDGALPVWIKTCPGKDGHLTGAPYYLTNKPRSRFVYDPSYAIRCPAEDYNAGREVRLSYAAA